MMFVFFSLLPPVKAMASWGAWRGDGVLKTTTGPLCRQIVLSLSLRIWKCLLAGTSVRTVSSLQLRQADLKSVDVLVPFRQYTKS